MIRVLVVKIVHYEDKVDWYTEVYALNDEQYDFVTGLMETKEDREIYPYLNQMCTEVLEDYRIGPHTYTFVKYMDFSDKLSLQGRIQSSTQTANKEES